jgi:hypothetical protein
MIGADIYCQQFVVTISANVFNSFLYDLALVAFE